MNEGQSRRASAGEIALNYLIGYVIAMGTQVLVSRAYGLRLDLAQNAQITMIFTFVSVVRSYILRRVFNHFNVKALRQASRRSGN